MAGEGEIGAELPLDVGVEQFGQQQRVEIPLVNRAAEQRAHRLEDLFVLIVGGAAALDQVTPQP